MGVGVAACRSICTCTSWYAMCSNVRQFDVHILSVCVGGGCTVKGCEGGSRGGAGVEPPPPPASGTVGPRCSKTQPRNERPPVTAPQLHFSSSAPKYRSGSAMGNSGRSQISTNTSASVSGTSTGTVRRSSRVASPGTSANS